MSIFGGAVSFIKELFDQKFFDQQKEKLIGEKVYREVRRQMPTVQDAWLEDQFLQVFSGILSQTQLGQPIGLVVIKDPQINAFAVPGGLFALNTEPKKPMA